MALNFSIDEPADAISRRSWQPMSTAPRDGLILLKTPIDGAHWPVIGRYSHIHGGFCTPAILGQNEIQLFPSAWAEIPPYSEAGQ